VLAASFYVFFSGGVIFSQFQTFLEGGRIVRRGVPDIVESILDELQMRAGDLTAAEAAQLARCSATRFRHIFTLSAGMNFRTARQRARLEYGRELLIQTRMTVPEISAKLRYSERTKFEKAFKRLYGLTPTQYRKQFAVGTKE